MFRTNYLEANNFPIYDHDVWKPELYKLQLEAPTPKAILRKHDLNDAPNFYGYEYHGEMGHLKAEKILNCLPDGSYLVRKSPGAKDYHTLTLRFDGKTHHYKTYYNPEIGHYLCESLKRFNTIHDLVADGLVNFYLEIHAASIFEEIFLPKKNCYQKSPYMTLNRRKLRALSDDIRKSLEPEKVVEETDEFKDNLSTEVEEIKMKNTMAINEEEDDEILPIIYEKSHTFKVHTFKGLNWCEFCANFLWGFTEQGVKCEDCGFIAHHKCSESVPPKCVPDLKRMRGIFGTDLTTIVTVHQCSIPFVIKRCVEEVESRGMLQEGIYRVSGFADEIEALKLALDRDGDKTDMSEIAYGNINVIAGTLKLYLRLLPIPLITFQTYPAFMKTTRCKTVNEQIICLHGAVKKLPPAHYNCLKYMVEHLSRVASHFAVNKMNEHNLATVFAPTLIATPQHLTDLSQEIFMLSTMITNCQAVFK